MGEGAAVKGWMNNGRKVSQTKDKGEAYDKTDQDLDDTGLLNNKLSDSNMMINRCEKNEGETPERGHWSNPCDFFISCLGYASISTIQQNLELYLSNPANVIK